MHNIFAIALREISRFTRNFRGAASPLAVVLLLATLGLSVLTLRERVTLGSGLYRLGASPDAPTIDDPRFTVQIVDAVQGRRLLEQTTIDVYVDGDEVIARQDEKSLYTVGALKRYLAQLELQRIDLAYPEEQAFPLRVGIIYLDPGSDLNSNTQDEQVVVPSLMTPTAPFTKVIIALIYILPVTFISIFFTSSFMEEKINRRLTVLMSTPISAFQIIVGKMLPYTLIALFSTALFALATQADVGQALLIYAPAMAFLFAIYLMVPLFYRTFKDITFISMLVTTSTTVYLVFPAMFNGISDLALMSPLTLAVKMYNNEPFGWREYLFPSLPLAAIFGLAMYAGTRLLNEEFLTGYRPITRKMAEAVFLILDRDHPYISVAIWSLMAIPVVYLMQLVVLVVASNLPVRFMLGAALGSIVLVEEIAKSISIIVLAEQGFVRGIRQTLTYAFLSALGFLVGEKLLLFVSISVVTETELSRAIFSSNTPLLIVPLLAHFFFTSIVALLTTRLRLRYGWALILAAILHSIYNWLLTGGLR